MRIVAGLSLRNLKPRVWDPQSPHYLPALEGVMVSYAELHKSRAFRRRAMEQGLRAALGVPDHIAVFLDNGAFYFTGKDMETPRDEYKEFVREALPEWYPIPQDYIPLPRMTRTEQRECLRQTMEMNHAYAADGYVPVVHISEVLNEYVDALQAAETLAHNPAVALGGIVPHLLRARKAHPYERILDSLHTVRQAFAGKELHLFGVGGTATLHLAALFGMDSVDSSGWRNRAARGIVQMRGSGERMVAPLGSWRGREPSATEWDVLSACGCPACRLSGVEGLKASGIFGFSQRATHNLWVLHEEAAEVERRLADRTYGAWFGVHLDNTTYAPLIRQAFELWSTNQA